MVASNAQGSTVMATGAAEPIKPVDDMTALKAKQELAGVLSVELSEKLGLGADTVKPAQPEESEETKLVNSLLKQLSSADAVERNTAASELANFVKAQGIQSLLAYNLVEKIKSAVDDKTAPASREGGLAAYTALAQTLGAPAQPYLIQLLPSVLTRYADKVPAIRAAAETAARAVITPQFSAYAVPLVLPALLEALDITQGWQTKAGALALMRDIIKAHPKVMCRALPDIVPGLSGAVNDARVEVKTSAFAALTEACANIGNMDVEPVMGALISCIARPAEVQDCVHKLAATTFVQQVEAPTLCILCPLLLRALRERVTAIKRKAALIIDNMAKLVEDPADATVFLPRLLPELEKVSKEAAQPDCRAMAAKAHATLLKVAGEGKPLVKKADKEAVLANLHKALAKAGVKPTEAIAPVLAYVAFQATQLMDTRVFVYDAWAKAAVLPYLAGDIVPSEQAAAVCTDFYELCQADVEKAEAEAEAADDEEGEDLCKCEFSLAYAAKILLSNTLLHLKRGNRYGLCGPNGCGKSTLMRAIANGQVDGFPPKDVLRTVYVEHDIDASLSDMAVVEFVFADPELQDASHPAHSLVEETLASVGFTPAMQQSPVASLSGGWKMKLALARAMLMRADILLLDEPTNHLDVTNVAWLEKYLTSLTNVTSMIVSHDSGFLDNVCTNIIHYEGRKLRSYRGNLSKFVEKVPEARSYYSLEDAQLKFTLPEPGFLEGVKTKDRAILKMEKVGFRYPSNDKNTISNATVYCSLNSRVACVGANGAGKSTLIKVLTGEVEATEGTVWKHPNLRIAYVAQHAFFHLEKHLDKTPVEYIQWRFAIGEDREGLAKVTRQVTEEEEKAMQAKFMHEGVKRQVEKLLGRRKLKKDYEYEVQWLGLPTDQTTWMTRDALEEMGFGKMVTAIDIKEAANAGLYARPLTTANVAKHLEDLGLENEFAQHSHVRGLSGGQKVKAVLAAATWQQPHMLVLDEPTNYLDRESLGALAGAIKEFGGGVIIISHHSEFTSALCPETWTVANGQLTVTGREPLAVREKVEFKVQEEMIDAFGNVVKVKAPKKKLSNKEKKALAKVRKARRERGEAVTDTEDDEC